MMMLAWLILWDFLSNADFPFFIAFHMPHVPKELKNIENNRCIFIYWQHDDLQHHITKKNSRVWDK